MRQVDVAALEQHLAQFTQPLDAADPCSGRVSRLNGIARRGQALDGKETKGAKAQGAAADLVSLVRHETGIVLGQRGVEGHNEIGAAAALLEGCNLNGIVTTMDALLTQRPLAPQILDQGGDYLMVVKRNQPTLYADIQLLFQSPPRPA